ncbi:hypothetical protein [Agrobacterium fabrum]|jgi:hypothetical protein|uniref:Uncharacterized protein n=1 Tax=Agrobacterium fabrum TaxID=1176649 RepID=A0A7Z7FNK8_9HYPH|nr:hypothetical protein [Agrobacterium fabrum]MCR6724636.1 hypothetical protein [Agrobacterium fabrum]UXT57591.1 hypothetical protein FY134_07985 [Agrobacterium fabrum]WCK75254.1 hypothetical protein G6L39_008175 [Agrobacterium fabrum]WIE26335.1 hypothetical protein G6L42_007890 [Agrobacterium fabrum]WIE42292.1 hypothetical protein G6L76_007890 [Agrobacterium fabrum]
MASFAVHLMQKPGPTASVGSRKLEDLPAFMLGLIPLLSGLNFSKKPEVIGSIMFSDSHPEPDTK